MKVYLYPFILIMLLLSLSSCNEVKLEASTHTRSVVESVSSVSFAGLASVDSITEGSAVLHWTHVDGASVYHIYNMTSGTASFVAAVTAPASSYTLTNLVPGHNYSFKVRMIDSNSFYDNNTVVKSFTTLASANAAPVATNITDFTSENMAVTVNLAYTDRENDLATSCAISSLTNGTTAACLCVAGSCSVLFLYC